MISTKKEKIREKLCSRFFPLNFVKIVVEIADFSNQIFPLSY
jgi:hypothetical protein